MEVFQGYHRRDCYYTEKVKPDPREPLPLEEPLPRKISNPLLLKVREWLEDISETIKFGVEWLLNLDQFLTKKIPKVWSSVKRGAQQSLSTAMKKLCSCKDSIVKVCKDNEVVLRSMLLKVGPKSFVRLGAQVTVKEGSRIATKALTKAITHPIGVVADVAQAGLEMAGYNYIGKKVGMWGNIAGGALGGFAVAGLVGAGVGAAVGTGVWFIGEVVGGLF